MTHLPRTCLALALATALLGAGAAGASTPALADAPSPAPETVTADALPTVQINGVVWKTAIVGRTVYAAGKFTRARPAGTALGSSAEVVRNNLLAFDLVTGALLPFAPSLDAQALTVAASPDGSRIYVGGDFTTVDGQVRSKVAAFSTADGSLVPTFAPSISAQVRAFAITGSTVYVGGNFFQANGRSRSRLAAFATSNGALLPWKPIADDDQVEALAVSPLDPTRVVVGGRFQKLNGLPQVGVGAVDAVDGSTRPWSSRPVPTAVPAQKTRSWVTSFAVVGDTVYASNDGEGGHWFDGRFAAKFSTGDLVWLDNCYGATYGIYTTGDVTYSVGHAHDCSSIGGFGESSPTSWHRTLAETRYAVGTDRAAPGSNSNYSGQPVPGLLHWFPELSAGSYTGQKQAAWAVTGNGEYLVEGGEFTTVNGVPQQGLVRFAIKGTAPRKVRPEYSTALIPTVVPLEQGALRVSWPATWDRDDADLRYDVYRDADKVPAYSVVQGPSGWTTTKPTTPTGPVMGFVDRGLVPGSTHSYRLRISDPAGNDLDGIRSATTTVADGPVSGPYVRSVLADTPSALWQLGGGSGTVYDSAAFTDAVSGTGVFAGAAGSGQDGGRASRYDGTVNGTTGTRSTVAMSTTAAFSLEAWVRTTSTTGGKIVGYGNRSSGASTSYDRQVYMDRSGHLLFGIFNGATRTVATAGTYNDGAYHHVVASRDPVRGAELWVDGVLRGRDQTLVSGEAYAGYWRIGGDNLSGWPGRGTSDYFAGSIDDVAVYPRALTADTIVRHYVASGRPSPAVAAPTDPYGAAVFADSPAQYWRLGETAGTPAADAGPERSPGTYTGGPVRGVAGAVRGTDDTAVHLDGLDDGVYSAAGSTPRTWSTELWFRSTSSRGGTLVGFSGSATGLSAGADRRVWLRDDGRLSLSVDPGQPVTVTTASPYHDGGWHHVVAGQGVDGMVLYVDGTLQGSDPQTAAQPRSGYWRVGGDTAAGSTSGYVSADVDEVAVYPTVLPAARVAAHYRVGTRTPPPNTAPVAVAGSACTALSCTLDGSGSSDLEGPVAQYAWDPGDGSPVEVGSSATAVHRYAAAGSFTATLVVTDAAGATATTTTTVVPTAPVHARDAFGREVGTGWGSADVGGSWSSVSAASAFSTAGGAGLLTLAAPGTAPLAVLAGISTADSDTAVSFTADRAATGGGLQVNVLGRRVGTADYRATVRLLATGTVGVALNARVDGVDTPVAKEVAVPGASGAPGTVLRARLQVVGTAPTTLRVKVWPADQPEPAGWLLTGTSTTASLQAPGAVGLAAYLSSSSTSAGTVVRLDDLLSVPTA